MKHLLVICLTLFILSCGNGSETQPDPAVFTHKYFINSMQPFSKETNYLSLQGYIKHLIRSAGLESSAPSISLEGTVWSNGNFDIRFYKNGEAETIDRTFYGSRKVWQEIHTFGWNWEQKGNSVRILDRVEPMSNPKHRFEYVGIIRGNEIIGVKKTLPLNAEDGLWMVKNITKVRE